MVGDALEEFPEQAVKDLVAGVTEDSADLSAVAGQDERRRYRYGPLKRNGGKRLVLNVDATQRRQGAFGGPRIGRSNFGVPALAPYAVGAFEHQQLAAAWARLCRGANKRPHSGTADKRYELPPLHVTIPT